MKVLALDTATEACSAALSVDGAVSERYEVIGRGHAERLLPMVQALLAEAGLALAALDGIAFGRGPGSFTGLRIGAGVTQGLAFGAGLRVAAVSDLAALASRAATLRGERFVLACLDARMAQVYWAAYDCADPAAPVALTPEAVSDPERVWLPGAAPKKGTQPYSDAQTVPSPDAVTSAEKGCVPFFGVGHGLAAYPALHTLLGERLGGYDADLLPHAREIALIGAREFQRGGGVDPELAVPVYLRDQVAHRK
jgi:tRNA threonylcarbamoyladenosine biosynthesis protein TsaB